MKVVDSHAHLEELQNVAAALKEAKEAGVAAVITVGSNLSSNRRALELAEEFSGYVFPALGLHPWSLKEDFSEDLNFIEQNISRCVALGEVGLDYWIKKDKELQLKAFKEILKISKRYNKPLILHTRGAWRDAFELVKEAKIERVIFHWYSGPLDILRGLLETGYLVSATPAAEYSEPLRRVLSETPIDRIVLETDTPVNYRGLEARPIHVLHTLNAVAKLKEIPPEEVAEATTSLATSFFGIKLE